MNSWFSHGQHVIFHMAPEVCMKKCMCVTCAEQLVCFEPCRVPINIAKSTAVKSLAHLSSLTVNDQTSDVTPPYEPNNLAEVLVGNVMDDKISLGLNYSKNRLRKNVNKKASKDKIEETVVTETEYSSEGKQTDTVQIVSLSSARVLTSNNEPTLCSLLTEVEDLDGRITEKIAEKERQGQELFRLKLDSEVKVLELSEIDGTIAQFRNKCDVLKKKS